MTIEELETLVIEAAWFEHLAEPLDVGNIVQIPNLHPWAGIPTNNERFEKLADQMVWLPSSRDQEDPFHGESLERRSEQLGAKGAHAQKSREIYKRTLASLRSFDSHIILKVGPHDFAGAARGAALFAARKAAYEILVDECGIWCDIMNLYKQGHWPCGVLSTREIVVI